MSEQQVHNYMSVTVDSFSQLPFIRPAPRLRDKPPSSDSGLRLFGFDFSTESNSLPLPQEDISKESTGGATTRTAANIVDFNTGSENGACGNRKFKCHYCCRNFPTSQALGGHQNAHKRERQHAKRAHFQSALAAQHLCGLYEDGHVYGFLNYHSLQGHPRPPPHYPAWVAGASGHDMTMSSAAFARFYGLAPQPIVDGNPLRGGPWKTPPRAGAASSFETVIRRDGQPMTLPVFGGSDAGARRLRAAGGGVVSGTAAGVEGHRHASLISSPSPKEGSSMSLDLHL